MPKILLLILMMFLYGCFPDSLTKWEDDSQANTSSGSNSSGGSIANTGCQSALCLTVTTQFETGGAVTTHATCTSDTFTAAATATCTASIPEGQLYLSKTTIEVTTNGDCKLFGYSPYYYRMGSSATFKDKNDATIDCSPTDEIDVPAGCFNGPGTTSSGFPSSFGQVSDTRSVSKLTETYDSPRKKVIEGKKCRGYANRWITNHLATPGTDVVEPVAGTGLVTATASLNLTSDITLTSVASGATRNTNTLTVQVEPAAANPTDTILAVWSGTAAAIVVTITPNDGTNNGATAVNMTTAELREYISSAGGTVVGKTITTTDPDSLRNDQTATGGDATVLVDAGEGDAVVATFTGGVDGSAIGDDCKDYVKDTMNFYYAYCLDDYYDNVANIKLIIQDISDAATGDSTGVKDSILEW